MRKRKLFITLLSLVVFCSAISVCTGKAYAETKDTAIPVKTMLFSTNMAPEYKSFSVQPGETLNLTVSPKQTGRMYIDVKDDAEEGDMAVVYVLKNGKYVELDETEAVSVTKGKVYKVRIKADKQNQNQVTVSLRASVYTTKSRNLSQGTSKWTIVSGVNKSGETATTYFKVKPDRTGLMTVALTEYGYENASGYVTLCDNSKKAISVATCYSPLKSKSVYFGVKKNKTYYLKVTKCKGTKKKHYAYGIQYKMTSATDRALGTKSSARKLVRKADPTKTLFTATGEKGTDWYKFYVSKTRVTKVRVSTTEIASGNVTLSIYKDGAIHGTPYTIKADSGGVLCQIENCSTPGKALSGWYYIKLEKSPKASGRYTIQYVQ